MSTNLFNIFEYIYLSLNVQHKEKQKHSLYTLILAIHLKSIIINNELTIKFN